MQITATPEYAVRAMLAIARMPATPEDDDKWCKQMLDMFQQQYDAGADRSAALLAALEAITERAEYVADGITVDKRNKDVSMATHIAHMAGHLAQHAKRARAAIARATGAEGGGEQ